jgi:hypothetical protein
MVAASVHPALEGGPLSDVIGPQLTTRVGSSHQKAMPGVKVVLTLEVTNPPLRCVLTASTGHPALD